MVAYNNNNLSLNANSQILAQYTGPFNSATKYLYLHDRLGSVRQVIDVVGDADVQCRYTYDPFGELFDSEAEETEGLNPFRFTGQYFDDELGQYYLRARQYDPHIARFTSRDPVTGNFEEPMTLHKYLYCTNNPINLIDPSGRTFGMPGFLMGTQRDFLVNYGKCLEQAVQHPNLSGITGVEAFAQIVDWLGFFHSGDNDNETGFMEDLAYLFTELSGRWGTRGSGPMLNFGQSGFAERFQEPQFPNSNQVRHFVGWSLAGYYWGRIASTSALYRAEHPYGGTATEADYLLGIEGITFGIDIQWGPFGLGLSGTGDWIREHLTD